MDLTVADAPAVRDFYAAVAGWTPAEVPMGGYSDYCMNTLERFLVNGGRRGFLVEIRPADLSRVLSPVEVSVAIAP